MRRMQYIYMFTCFVICNWELGEILQVNYIIFFLFLLSVCVPVLLKFIF